MEKNEHVSQVTKKTNSHSTSTTVATEPLLYTPRKPLQNLTIASLLTISVIYLCVNSPNLVYTTVWKTYSQCWLKTPTTIPAQLGSFPVSITDHLLHTDRDDALAPGIEKRRLMVTVYQPYMNLQRCPQTRFLPYMPPKTTNVFNKLMGEFSEVLKDIFLDLQVESCSIDDETSSTNATLSPILIFSHGGGSSRLAYVAVLQALASSGYSVVSVDHTYDASVVEFPNGDLALSNVHSPNDTDRNATNTYFSEIVIPLRTADIVSVLDAIQNDEMKGLKGRGESLKVGMLGHSLGGDTAVAATGTDDRVIACLVYDGGFHPYPRNLTISKPTLLLGSDLPFDLPFFPEWRANWEDEWKHLASWKLWLNVNGSMHDSFADLPLAVDVWNLRKHLSKDVREALGTIDSQRMQHIIWQYSLAFLDLAFNDANPLLLSGPSENFPEVNFTRQMGE